MLPKFYVAYFYLIWLVREPQYHSRSYKLSFAPVSSCCFLIQPQLLQMCPCILYSISFKRSCHYWFTYFNCLHKEYSQSTVMCSTTWHVSQLLEPFRLDLISKLAWFLLFYLSKDKGSVHEEDDWICHMQNVICKSSSEMLSLPVQK